ncbi:MAG: hypothetical protein IPO68_09820 [Chitinophagaceae bacterium]|nr:hypothetical protein [Chitinophagaceae bacterium]
MILYIRTKFAIYYYCQRKTSERDDKTAQRRTLESDDKKVAEAIKIGKQAERLWKDDQLAEAEKLYYKSIGVFPVFFVIDEFATRKMKMGDIKGANKAWTELEKAFIKVAPDYYKESELKDNLELVYRSMANNNFESGYTKEAVEATIKYLELFRERKPGSSGSDLIKAASDVAFFQEDKQTLKQINAIASTYDKDMFGGAKFGQFITEVLLKTLDGDYDAVEIQLNDIIKNRGGFWGPRK